MVPAGPSFLVYKKVFIMERKNAKLFTAFILALALILTMLPAGTVSAVSEDTYGREDCIGRLGMKALDVFDDSAAWGEIKDKALLAAGSIKDNEAAKAKAISMVGSCLTDTMKKDTDSSA